MITVNVAAHELNIEHVEHNVHPYVISYVTSVSDIMYCNLNIG